MFSESDSRNLTCFDDAELIAGEEEMFRWQAAKAEKIIAILSNLQPRRFVADIGCFTGRMTLEYRRAGVERLDGFDASPRALACAEARGINTRLWRADREPCPADNESYDVTVAADVIEHLVNTDTFMAELKRITRKDGHLIISTPNLAFWLNRIRLLTGKVPWSYPGTSSSIKEDPMVDTNHIRISTISEWTHFFRVSGLAVESRTGYSLMGAIEGGWGVKARQRLDHLLGRWPELAFGTIYVLRLPA